MHQDNFGQSENRKVSPTIISIIIIALLALAAGAVYVASQSGDGAAPTGSQGSDDATSAPSNDTNSAPVTNGDYNDGTYSATGQYSTPGGTESVDVTATLENGVVSSVETTGSATGGNSAQFQGEFLSAYESEVVGKSVDEIALSRVAGSSLTSGGFNDALDQIKRDALS